MKPPRQAIHKDVETRILVASRRRCCLCYFVKHIKTERKGQIAHLSGDPSHTSFDDLVFLCLEHHDEFDGRTRQAKGLTEHEVRHYRDKLYEELVSEPAPAVADLVPPVARDSVSSADQSGGITARDVSIHVAQDAQTKSADELRTAIGELERRQLLDFFKQNKADLLRGMAVEGTDRRRDALGELKMLGLVEMEHFAAIPETTFAGVPGGGAPPYDLWKTTATGDRLARMLDGSLLAAETRPTATLECKPLISVDQRYGRAQDQVAAYVVEGH